MTRSRLPNRRRAINLTRELAYRVPGDVLGRETEFPFEITLGYDAAGTLLEVFAQPTCNLDSTLAFMMSDFAALLSVALQHGARLPDIDHTLAHMPGRGGPLPASIVGALIATIAAEPPLKEAEDISRLVNTAKGPKLTEVAT